MKKLKIKWRLIGKVEYALLILVMLFMIFSVAINLFFLNKTNVMMMKSLIERSELYNDSPVEFAALKKHVYYSDSHLLSIAINNSSVNKHLIENSHLYADLFLTEKLNNHLLYKTNLAISTKKLTTSLMIIRWFSIFVFSFVVLFILFKHLKISSKS